MAPPVRIPIWNYGLWRQSHLAGFFDRPLKVSLLPARAGGGGAWLCWGAKPGARRAAWYAAQSKEALLRLEDGFLRSCGLGVDGDRALSLVVDDLGIYYDATRPSRLEALVAASGADGAARGQARRAIGLIRRHRLSKYNHAPELHLPPLSSGLRKRVLVVDQTMGDVSVRLGGADAGVFAAMLHAALDENPDAEVWIKTHPDVLSGKKQAYLNAPGLASAEARLRLLAEDVSPLMLLEQVDKVYVVTSQMGFEALLLDKEVVCFGWPWYAGWGLTDDRGAAMANLHARRTQGKTVEQLFEAAYLLYARYIDPLTGAAGTIFDVIEWLVRNKTLNDQARGTLYCVGMSRWKRAIVRPFLTSPSTRLRFVGTPAALARQHLEQDGRIVLWGIKHEAAIAALAKARKLPVWRMEDGFLRSVGLGSDLFRPLSLVLDHSGMYYDPLSGSALERMLASQEPEADDLERAARFRREYVKLKLSKYNLERPALKIDSKGRRVLLVPGQVEDDASIRRGSPLVRSNLELLRTVRAANPDACILYKAHPDVVAGNRQGAVPPQALASLADHCLDDANIIDCIQAADEIHTMTSLSGFEALLHGRIVHCYGGPFYAGWGLTVDHFKLSSRKRQIGLDALVFAVMLDYPRYVLPGVPGFASAEQLMHYLLAQAGAADARAGGGWLARKLRKGKALLELFIN